MFALVLKSPDGEWPIKYTHTHTHVAKHGNLLQDITDLDQQKPFLSCLFNTHRENGALSILPLSVSYDRSIGGTSGGGPLINFGHNITTEIRSANRFFAPIRELIRES